jgi:hypothetical protein
LKKDVEKKKQNKKKKKKGAADELSENLGFEII